MLTASEGFERFFLVDLPILFVDWGAVRAAVQVLLDYFYMSLSRSKKVE